MEPELILFYTFSQCTNAAIDSSQYGNNGSLQSAALLTLPVNTYCYEAGEVISDEFDVAVSI